MRDLPVYPATSVVVVRRQLRPQPSPDALPYWCYNHTLVFYDSDETGRYILNPDQHTYQSTWERDLPEIRWGRARVEWTPMRGWDLILEVTHERALRVLALLAMEIEPGADPQWNLPAAACAHDRDTRRLDGSCWLCGSTASTVEVLRP